MVNLPLQYAGDNASNSPFSRSLLRAHCVCLRQIRLSYALQPYQLPFTALFGKRNTSSICDTLRRPAVNNLAPSRLTIGVMLILGVFDVYI